MNKLKKTLMGMLIATGVGCAATAAACANSPTYYDLTFESNGVDVVMQGALAETDVNGNQFVGGKVQAGTEVKFSVIKGANTTGTVSIVVYDKEKNTNTTLYPDSDGFYSFTLNANTEVKVEGISKLYRINLRKAERSWNETEQKYDYYTERMVTYLDEQGNPLGDSVEVAEGESFKFKMKISPYYIPKFKVIFNDEEIVPSAEGVTNGVTNGVYTVENIRNLDEEGANISVANLEQDDASAFALRSDCGSGTESDPYLISKPIDLFYMAALVNGSMTSATYSRAHYKLTADIDMQGEKLFVIGDSSESTAGEAAFMGSFDGDGHTIKNFYMTDEVIDQETGMSAYLPYMGLFGYAVATTSNPITIKNVKLDNFKVTVHPGAAKNFSYAGALVGFGIGVQMTGCSATNGEVIAIGDDQQMIYMGGLMGLAQAAYGNFGTNIVTYDSFLRGCYTDVIVEGTGSPRSAGGLVGYLASAHKNAIAYVVNSYSLGTVSGAMHSGGIVGTVGRYATISNCYTTAEVTANNSLLMAIDNDEYKKAFAGGIAGYVSEDGVISSCYSKVAYMDAVSSFGAGHAKTDGIAAGLSKGGEASIESSAAIIINNKKASNADTKAVFTELGWSDKEWNFEGALPEIALSSAARTFTVKVMAGGNGQDGTQVLGSYSKRVTGNRQPIYAWYNDKNMPEYVTGSAGRSWGYYFDKELTQRVPYGFVPMADETVFYVGFANYEEIAGRYYMQSAANASGAYIDLSADGQMFFRNGGMNIAGVYSYDGENIVVYDTGIHQISISLEQNDGANYTLAGKMIDGGFTLSGFTSLLDLQNSTEENPQYTEVNFNYTLYKAVDGLTLGTYKATDGSTYTFVGGLTGVYVSAAGVRTNFTYTVSGNTVTLTLAGGASYNATLAGGEITAVNNRAVSLLDEFAGNWRSNANSPYLYSFDGQGKVVYTDDKGVSKTYDYEVQGGKAVIGTDGGDLEVYLSDGGLNANGLIFRKDDGFTGNWYWQNGSERIEISLYGLNGEGYGEALVSYTGNSASSISAQYGLVTSTNRNNEVIVKLNIYAGDMQYGSLTVNGTTGAATGFVFSAKDQGYRQDCSFKSYDLFKGVWVSNAEGINTLTFSGVTEGDSNEVVLRSESGTMTKGKYTLTDALNGKLTVGADEYTITFAEYENKVYLTKSGARQELARRDEWYGVTLYDGETAYTFDGKGYIGGKVTVTGGTSYDYTVDGNGVVTLNGTQLVATEEGFTFGSTTLKFKTNFVGEWYVQGTLKKLTVTEVSGHLKANVTFEGEEGSDFVYDPANRTLTYTAEEGGQTVVTTLKIATGNELTLIRSSIYGSAKLTCIKTDMADKFMGVYSSLNGASWTFDGLGGAQSGNGTAVYVTANGISSSCGYKINALGLPVLVSGDYTGYVFKTVDGWAFQKQGENEYYDFATPDALYETRVYVMEYGNRVWYVFDGFKRLWRETDNGLELAYTYEMTSTKQVTLSYGEGPIVKIYDAVIKDAGKFKEMTVTERK